MSCLKGIKLSSFMDVYQEWHAFVEGLSEVLCPWPPRHKPSPQLADDIRTEHHYYMFGRAIGVIAWIIIAKIIKEAFL